MREVKGHGRQNEISNRSLLGVPEGDENSVSIQRNSSWEFPRTDERHNSSIAEALSPKQVPKRT
jgi:hypothetical protein